MDPPQTVDLPEGHRRVGRFCVQRWPLPDVWLHQSLLPRAMRHTSEGAWRGIEGRLSLAACVRALHLHVRLSGLAPGGLSLAAVHHLLQVGIPVLSAVLRNPSPFSLDSMVVQSGHLKVWNCGADHRVERVTSESARNCVR